MARGPVGHPTLSPEKAERVWDALNKLYRERYDKNGTALARALKRSQAGVSQLLTRKNAPSYDTALRVAALMGISVGELLGDEGPSSGKPRPRPNLVEAIDYVTSKGRASAETVRDVSAAARYLPDLDVTAWLTLLGAVEAARLAEETQAAKGPLS